MVFIKSPSTTTLVLRYISKLLETMVYIAVTVFIVILGVLAIGGLIITLAPYTYYFSNYFTIPI